MFPLHINHEIDFADHNTTANIPVRILAKTTMTPVVIPIDDEVYENDETFKAVITSTSESDDNVKIGMINTTNITIKDNDNIDIYFQKSVYEFGEERETYVVQIHARLPMSGSQANVLLETCITEENATSERLFISVAVVIYIVVKTKSIYIPVTD